MRKMKIFYTDMPRVDFDPNEDSIFLAGPSPRNSNVKSWRPEALSILEELKYDGRVFVPEFSKPTKNNKFDFLDQVGWEDFFLTHCKKIVFWVPRNMKTMPALTTNVEFGRFVPQTDRHVFYGRPDDAPNNRYLDWMYIRFRYSLIYCNLRNLLERAVKADWVNVKHGMNN